MIRSEVQGIRLKAKFPIKWNETQTNKHYRYITTPNNVNSANNINSTSVMNNPYEVRKDAEQITME